MKNFYVVGLALVGVFAMGVLYASSAFAAESRWLVDGAIPTAAHQVDSETSGPISFADEKGGIFGEEVQMLCEGTDLGTVGPGAADTLETITITKCVTDKGICGEPLMEPLNLPWTTSIELIGGVFYDDITTAVGNKNVGYRVICNKNAEDTCEFALGRALLENSGNNVNSVFNSADANQPKGTCVRGGAGAGLINGTDIILSETGLTVAISEA
ncbi:MAG TPA: hypothetical protein VFW38_11350 [Solirubrobacteraceae bacterium]|nr:hypothetical protein [Solirubrobacteraceae bacterium]